MLVSAARRIVPFVALAAALATVGCSQTVAGSARPAPDSSGPLAAAPAGHDCPSPATLSAALPQDGAGGTYTLSGPVLCSGDYAVAAPLYASVDPQGDDQPVSVTQLFHRVGDGWQAVDRTPLCADGSVPAEIYELTCESN